jgi:anti-sigma factor RsiW
MSIVCEQMRECMSLWLDDRLTEAEQRQLRGHLRGCQDCRSQMDALRGVDDLLAGAALVSPTAGFAKRFQSRLIARRQRRRTMIGLLLLAAATVFLLLVGMGSLAASSVWEWQGTTPQVGGLLASAVDSAAVMGRVVENVARLVLVLWRAFGRILGHPLFMSSALATALLAVAWVWVVGKRPHAYRPVRA